VPSFDEFQERGFTELPEPEKPHIMFEGFRADPEKRRLNTPSGKIEIFSETIASFGYDDCAGHPTWMEPDEWLRSEDVARFPLHMIANNPKTRLHSQLDIGHGSKASKIQDREPMRMHPTNAAERGISDGDVVRVFNDRGSLLAGVLISEQIRPDVVQLSTGAWFDPIETLDGKPFCVHGNPNVLTRDIGTSKLGQGCTGQHALVQVEKWSGELPPVRAHLGIGSGN
jgi:biotin/methionine sulfoxide reductase